MAKKKLQRIQAVKNFANVSHAPHELKGGWQRIFANNNPITVELGCGRGDVLLALAERHKNRNFVGVDLKGVRLWAAAKQALDKDLKNVYFICSNILDLPDAFEPGDISEFWVTFPDPYPKKPRKRMTAKKYLDVYMKISKPGAVIRLKTDDDDFYQFSIKSLADYGCTILSTNGDVHGQREIDSDLQILTTYERRHIANGLKIKYIEFSLPSDEQGAT